ncbi:P-loop containing nucleoside triphosphate hydrolase protein [Amylocystis lapponica]|nr:P-loop containing nucleoside triphosphate hydrolase protein [Amylocystis lapponica]
MSREICHFYSKPGGCRRGPQCNFLHIDQANAPARRPPTSPSSTRVQSGSSKPYGACIAFWDQGRCYHEFKCKYKHIANPAHTQAPSGPPARSEATTIEAVASFLTPEGLARLSDSGTDGFFATNTTKSLGPSEVHNYIKKYLNDSYRFPSALDVYSFVGLISNANAANSKWSAEDGQLLLSMIGTGNGLLRLNDVICWPEVSIRAGSNKSVVSFQRGYLPLLRYFTSDFVVKSITSQAVNGLYNLIIQNFDHFSEVVSSCMDDAVSAKSFKDRSSFSTSSTSKDLIGSQVIVSLIKVLFECVTRFKNVIATHPLLHPLVLKLRGWTEQWVSGISATPPTFDDPLATSPPLAREHIVQHINTQLQQLVAIADRKHTEVQQSQRPSRSDFLNEGILAALENAYEGPGELRADGPRHSNDHIHIAEIRIAPTHDELQSIVPPFLPANIYGSPHPLPAESMERLLDIQFRLLREELIASLRASVRLVVDDLMATQKKTQLADLIKKGGGKYRGHVAGQETVLFNLYSGVDFSSFTPDFKGLSAGLSFDAPPGRARSSQAQARVTFWESMSSKRLMQGGLVALIWQRNNEIDTHLGTIASSTRELAESARRGNDRVAVRISFFDPDVELRILQELQHPERAQHGTRILVEATVMYESIRPFLDALRVEPETLPFSTYLPHHPPSFYNALAISPPQYARMPKFTFQLASLFPPEADVRDFKLSVTDPASVLAARERLKRNSRLDSSQADAVVDALTRELVLIQGPPGTGKSYTGVELLRVLLANHAGPVLMLAFTNHALDHLLGSVLDAGITKKVVRLGSRSADERISEFSIENMEKIAGKSRLDRAFAAHYRALRDVETEIKELMKDFLNTRIGLDAIQTYVETQYPAHFESLVNAPQWIQVLHSVHMSDGENGPWKIAGRHGHDEESDDSLYTYWQTGRDQDFLESAANDRSSSMLDPEAAPSRGPTRNSFDVLASIATPDVNMDSEGKDNDSPDVNMDLESDSDSEFSDGLLEEAWMHIAADSGAAPMSPLNVPEEVAEAAVFERDSIPSPEPHPSSSAIRPSDFVDLKAFFQAFGCEDIPSIPSSNRPLEILTSDDCDDVWTMSLVERQRLHLYWTSETRLQMQQARTQDFERLREKHATALKDYNEGREEGIAPRIMLVEEAGQVLEAHILGSLVPSVQHLILIGDPLQLRPTLNNYSLSMENKRGGMLFKFDMSLMERLSTAGLPMSQIDVQRRMRPQISNLIRTTLYPALEDHELVKQYPPVQGMAKNVFFLNHNHKENGADDDSVSKYNVYEVGMIKDLVMYLLRQGPYSAEGDIVVLCAYLGQLARVRDALSNEVAIVIDERDQAELDDRDADKDDSILDKQGVVEHVKVSRRVRLRTVDNYQGEEAKIIILSLVRNSGGSQDDEAVYGHSSAHRANIGFLRSNNRVNVALSRAREGLSDMWRSVMEELESKDSVGDAFPVQCNRHQDVVEHVSKPGQLPGIAPTCGHLCPYKCHSDDTNHLAVACIQRCTRLCPRGHPCSKQCAEPCGRCSTRIENVQLPCGHVKRHVHCYELDDLGEVTCDEMLVKRLPACEHEAKMKCSEDPSRFRCKAACRGVMPCCGRNCGAQCFQCQQLNVAENAGDNEELVVAREKHVSHPCERTLYCGHVCGNACSQDHECATICKAPCRQVCPHARCKNYCSTPCAPCQEPCTWQVPILTVCARLPCDQRCEKLLECGHRCPSVCGEDCTIQTCPMCASSDVKQAVVDLIMQTTLADVNVDAEMLDELIITLPNCGHVFTVETLDGICEMNEYYKRADGDGKWLGLQAPPAGFMKPPACPTCRSAITSPRYGRIFKRADLDILENNVAFHMSRLLSQVHAKAASISKTDLEERLKAAAKDLKTEELKVLMKEFKNKVKHQNTLLKTTRLVPVALRALDPSTEEYHDIQPSEARQWKKLVSKVLMAYGDAVKVAGTRSSHVHAWEASFSYLYQTEMDDAVQNPDRAPRNPQEHAMRMARMKVGQPPPRADKRFLVEAFWMTITLRLTLVELAGAWLEALRSQPSYPHENRRMWAAYISFILRTCATDLQIALDITTDSGSHRQKTKTALLTMRVELEQFRFNVQMTQQTEKFKRDLETRHKLADSADVKGADAATYMESVIGEHRRARGERNRQEEEWVSANFSQPASTLVDEWQAIARSLRQDTFYEPLSLDEMTQIVQSQGFSHTGHFYKCPNGHTFVIGECGGAMQQSKCPECGEVIGGTGHNLVSGNSRATEFEEIARAQGGERSPWRWGM